MTRENVSRYAGLAQKHAAANGLRAAVVLAMVDVESWGRPEAVNLSGAAGLMQVKPVFFKEAIHAAAEAAGIQDHAARDDETLLMHPEVGIAVGCRHMGWCVRDCGSEERGLARYHTNSCDAGDHQDSGGTKTRVYVARVMALVPEYAAWLDGDTNKQKRGLDIIKHEVLAYGRVAPPPITVRTISPTLNTAHNRLGPRRKVGVCRHRMQGSLRGTDGYFRGDARNRALTDFGIGGPWDGSDDGVVYQWVPGDADYSPWANGVADHLEGDGIAFVRVMGLNAVNRDLRSIELSDGGNINAPYGPTHTADQWAANVQLTAYVFDQAEVPYHAYPLNPTYGIVTELEHWEFSSKQCPFPEVRGMTPLFQDAVRAVLKSAQTGINAGPSVPPPVPTVPVVPFNEEANQAFLKDRFGTITRRGAAGASVRVVFDPKGVVSNAWLHRAMEEDTWPSIESWEVTTGRTDVSFSNGWLLLWDGAAWRWAGRSEEETE